MNPAPLVVAVSIAMLVQACSESAAPAPANRALSLEFLMEGTGLEVAVPLTEFTRPEDATGASNTFSGRLQLDPQEQGNIFRVLVDELKLADLGVPGMAQLPSLDTAFIQAHGHLIPVQRGPIQSGHNWWELIFEPGPVWDEPADHGYSRAVIPFSLKERNADCIHNGLISFLFNDQGDISKLAFQISNQTCKYLQFEFRGLLEVAYEPGKVAQHDALAAGFQGEIANRMPQRPITHLPADYPAADAGNFGSSNEIDPKDMSVFGFVIDGVHYVGGCATALGPYPYCDDMALPSYSLAKSLVGGLGLMRAEKLYPGSANAMIGDLVPECSQWAGVTIRHAMDLATGRYGSLEPHFDENAAIVSDFFIAEDHTTKINAACDSYQQQSVAGKHWVYHSSDIYLAGVALNGLLKVNAGPGADLYDDLIVAGLWKPLGLSPLLYSTRRTRDGVAQPFTAWGLSFHRDDIARIALFLGPADGRINGQEVFDRRLFDAIKQRIPGDRGLVAEHDLIRYINGFRSRDVTALLGCKSQTWVTTMSGYGGIEIVLMPNDTAYYYFSDGGVHRYLEAIKESHRIRSMCSRPTDQQ